MSGLRPFAISGSMGLWFLYRSYRLFQDRTDAAAQGVFRVSLVFLFAFGCAASPSACIAAASSKGTFVCWVPTKTSTLNG